MKISRKLLYLVSFVGLATVAVLAFSRIGYPSTAATLVWAAIAASLAGAPGLIHRRAWPSPAGMPRWWPTTRSAKPAAERLIPTDTAAG